MKTLKEYIIEWSSLGGYTYDYEKYHNVDNLEGKELEEAAKYEFEEIKNVASDFKHYTKVKPGQCKAFFNVPALIKYIGLNDKLKTDVQAISIDVLCKNSFPRFSRYNIVAGSHKSLTSVGLDVGGMDAYTIAEGDELECKSAAEIIKTYIKPIVSDFKHFCKWLESGLTNGKYWNRRTGEGLK